MTGLLKSLKSLFTGSVDDKLTELKDKRFSEVVFVVLDLETSGLDVGKDKILSFGGVKIVGGQIQVHQSLEKVFRQKKDTINENSEIHGLLNKEISEGDEKDEGLREVWDFIGDAIVVGHHVGFDYSMLDIAFQKYFKKGLDNLTLDTATLAIRLEKGALGDNFRKEEFGLDELCKRFEIETFDRHTAPGDAFITAQLLLKLLALGEVNGIKTVGQLLEKRKSGLF